MTMTAAALLAEDRSVASGRTMADIAAGEGRGPKPFILASPNRVPPDAIWNSNEGSAEELRATGAVRQKPAQKAVGSKELSKPKSRASGSSARKAWHERYLARLEIEHTNHPEPSLHRWV